MLWIKLMVTLSFLCLVEEVESRTGSTYGILEGWGAHDHHIWIY